MTTKRESTFMSIGTCDICGNTGMELFQSNEGLACVTCRHTVDVREPMQLKTMKRYQREIQYLRNRLENHGGH